MAGRLKSENEELFRRLWITKGEDVSLKDFDRNKNRYVSYKRWVKRHRVELEDCILAPPEPRQKPKPEPKPKPKQPKKIIIDMSEAFSEPPKLEPVGVKETPKSMIVDGFDFSREDLIAGGRFADYAEFTEYEKWLFLQMNKSIAKGKAAVVVKMLERLFPVETISSATIHDYKILWKDIMKPDESAEMQEYQGEENASKKVQ